MKPLFRLIVVFIAMLVAACGNNQNTMNLSNTSGDTNYAHNENMNWITSALGIETKVLVADTALREDDTLFSYGSFIGLPKLYSKNNEYQLLNREIANDFDSIVKQTLAKPKANKDEYHKIFYDYYLHDSIITIKVTDLYAWHLTEATTAFAVYHFDLKNNKLLSTKEMFDIFGMSQLPVLSAFAEQCSMPPDYTEPLFNINWFNKVKWKDLNQMKFYINNEQKMVIIYPMAENGIEAELILE